MPIPEGASGVRIGRGEELDNSAHDRSATGRRRASPAEVKLSDPRLSRAHLRVLQREDRFEVVDEGSLNGTFLDGRRLDRPMRLDDGCILCFGRHAAVFRLTSRGELPAIEEEARAPFGPVATISPSLAASLSMLRRLARTDAEILLLGETGVGKEVYARALHRASGRRGRFIALNCAAIPSALAESELFGYARGAHSTATEAKPGLIVAADGGTLFLDELADASARLQAKLLRFLQDREVWPVGATAGRRVDVKIVAATHSIEIEGDRRASSRRLREDLVARFGAEPITIPPLRHRMEDLGALIAHFSGSRAITFEPEAHRALYCYGWPRNVRELEKVVQRAVTLAADGRIGLEHLPAAARTAAANGPPIAVVSRRQRGAPPPEVLKDLLVEHDGNLAAVARALDRQWTVVKRWVKRHDLEPGAPDGPSEASPMGRIAPSDRRAG